MKLKSKIISLNLFSIIILGILIAGINFYFVSKQLHEVSSLTRTKFIEQKKSELKNLVITAESIIKNDISHITSDKNVQKNIIINELENMRYGTDGYFFAYDTSGTKITYAFHGINKDWAGNAVDLEKKDNNGKKYLKEMIKGAMENGEQFVDYIFYNPTSQKDEEKLAYALYIPQENIIVVTGFYIEDINQNINQLMTNLKLLFSEQNIITNIIFIIVAVVLIILSLLFSNKISKPINNLKSSLEKVAEGYLNIDINIKSKDEIGELGKTFNSFTQNLKETMIKIKDMSHQVEYENMKLAQIMDNIINGHETKGAKNKEGYIEKGIIHLNKQIEEILDNVRNQTASSEESLASLEEISATSDNMSANTKKAVKDFLETQKLINDNLNDIENMGSGMEDISQSVQKTNVEIEKLKNLSTDIENILNAINGISDQTNLLALNAAIEAARAGEAGRGFAVVAEEIRKLAEGTSEETKKIEKIINIIQSEVESVKTSGDLSKEKVYKGLELMDISRENTVKISELTESNNNQINEIMSFSFEQSTASKEITGAITTITESSIQIESLSHDTSTISMEIQNLLIERKENVEELHKMAIELKKDLEFFKI